MQPALPQVFAALADPTRFAIVERLLNEGEKTASDIAEPFAMSAPAVSRHLKVLEEAGMIERRIEAQWRVFRLKRDRFSEIGEWLRRYRDFWEDSLDRLDDFLTTKQKGGENAK